MNVVIDGIGTAVPPYQVQQDEAGEVAAQYCGATPTQARTLKGLYRLSGVETRGSVVLKKPDGALEGRQDFFSPYTTDSPGGPTTSERMGEYEIAAAPLALNAAKGALERAGVAFERITHLVTVTCSGFASPGFDIELIRNLPLRSDVARAQIGFMGCHAALNALRVARAFVLADPNAVVLVCCVELCSLHYQYGWDPEQIVANALFADGAAACVIRDEDRAVAETRTDICDAHRPRARILANGSTLLPDSLEAMSWRISNHGFRMTLSSKVPSLLADSLRPWLTQWLAQHGYTVESITRWAVHPGGPQILHAFAKTMGLSEAEMAYSQNVLRRYGNMSSPTVLFVLDDMNQAQATGPCVVIGFGPGLTAEVMLLV